MGSHCRLMGSNYLASERSIKTVFKCSFSVVLPLGFGLIHSNPLSEDGILMKNYTNSFDLIVHTLSVEILQVQMEDFVPDQFGFD